MNKEVTINKLEALQKKLQEIGKVAIAYSGGVDSHFLLAAAAGCLPGSCVYPVLCSGDMMSDDEIQEAEERMAGFGIGGAMLKVDVLQVPAFVQNDRCRCYHCKKYLMDRIRRHASEAGFQYVLDGKNLDDSMAYRPGARAASELGIISPLYECGFTKKEIREWSRRMGLETWDKPANACLATRFPYGTLLTKEKLRQAADAEQVLHKAGIRGGRIRIHGDIARIEADPGEFGLISGNRELAQKIKECGFTFVTLDLEGYRSGSFDEKKPHTEEQEEADNPSETCDEVEVLEANLDDCPGEWLGYVMELLLEAGARDVFCTPVFMKKNRPGYQITVLCMTDQVTVMENILFQETTTIGIRRRQEQRSILKRRLCQVDTRYGKLIVKEVQAPHGKRIYPEYESARDLAKKHGVGLQDIYTQIH